MTGTRRSPWRRLIFPVLILLIAAVLWSTGQRSQTRDNEEVRRFVRELCMTVVSGRSIDTMLRDSTAQVREHLPGALDQILQPPLDAELTELRVEVEPGDHPDYGNGTATHTAMIVINDVPMLGLRIKTGEPARPMRVLGYWKVDDRRGAGS